MEDFDAPGGAFKLAEDLWEYLLVAQPDAVVSEKIAEEKSRFCESYNLDISARANSSITIAQFLAKEELEETLERWIQNICNLQEGFITSFNNFSGIPPHTVFLRILDTHPFQKLGTALKILDGFMLANHCPPINLVNKPHLSIAGNLPQYIYEHAIKEYAHKSFHASFKVDRLFLLKRDEYMNCKTINSFILPSPLT